MGYSPWGRKELDISKMWKTCCWSRVTAVEAEKPRQGKVRRMIEIPPAIVYCLKSGDALDRILSSFTLNEKILWKLKCLTILPAWNLFLDIYKMMTSSIITCQPFVKSRAIYFSCFYRLEICMNHFLNSKLPDSHLNLFLLISGTQLQSLWLISCLHYFATWKMEIHSIVCFQILMLI